MIAAKTHAIDDARRWTKVLAPYREPSLARSLAELAVTAVPFAVLWLLMWLSLRHAGYGLTLLLAIPTAGFLVRLFMIQHDCGHGSFFRRRWANDWLGRAIGVLTLTAYHHWRRRHAVHHATGGNLDQRGVGDVRTLTVKEFQELSAWPRLVYRLTRHPLVVLGIGPVYVFVLKHRLPSALRTAGRDAWTSVLATNLAIAVLAMAWRRWSGGATSCWSRRRSPGWPPRSAYGCSTSSISSRAPPGSGTRTGPSTPEPWRAARTSTCRRSCAGSPPTSGSTTSTISRPGSRAIGWARCCATIPSYAA